MRWLHNPLGWWAMAGVGLFLAVGLMAAGRAADSPATPAPAPASAGTAVDEPGVTIGECKLRALRALQKTQHPDGYWPNDPACPFKGEITSLVVLAFLSEGRLPGGDAQYGKNLELALKWLALQVDRPRRPRPQAAQPDTVTAYDDILMCYALSEAYGMTRVPFLKPGMGALLRRMLDEQNAWLAARKQAVSADNPPAALTRVTWRMLALRAGYLAPGCQEQALAACMEDTVTCLKPCLANGGAVLQNPELAGVLYVLCLLGRERLPEVTTAQDLLAKEMVFDWRQPPAGTADGLTPAEAWFFQRWATFLGGIKYWRNYNPVLCGQTARNQSPDGFWEIAGRPATAPRAKWDRFYTTPLAIMMLYEGRWLPTYKMPKTQSTERSPLDLEEPKGDGLKLQ